MIRRLLSWAAARARAWRWRAADRPLAASVVRAGARRPDRWAAGEDADTIMFVRHGPIRCRQSLRWVDRHVIPGRISYTGVADNRCAGVDSGCRHGLLACSRVSSCRRRARPWPITGASGLCPGRHRTDWALALSLPMASARCRCHKQETLDARSWFVVGGYSMMMFALFHGIVDVLGCRKWASSSASSA